MSNTISIIINNYNYGRFLNDAITSIVNQTHKPHEIIVVDDGSTDNSRNILAGFRDTVKIIYKENGGQASAFNRGYAEATGDWIWFVDADDFLMPDGVKTVIEAIAGNESDIRKISKIHSPLYIVKGEGQRTNNLYPSSILSSGFVVEEVVSKGGYNWPPTTGNIFHRSMMEKCMPMPEDEYRLCADFFLCSFAPFEGLIVQTTTPVGYYRIHPHNNFHSLGFTKQKLARNGEILLRVAVRTTQLIRQNTRHKDYQFPFDRRTLETVVIAKRFGNLKLPSNLNGISLHKLWLKSEEIKTASVKNKVVAFAYWLLLNLAPQNLTAFFIKRGMRKLSVSREIIYN
ncbi:glycosyltransferase family 2 protein [Flavitalea antarctica]